MIYVITSVHNRRKITADFIDLLLAQSCKDIRPVIVDDGSADGTAAMIKEKMPVAEIITGNGNLWWGGALNEAYKWMRKHAEPDAFVMIANDDSAFAADYIESAIKILSERPHTLLTGCGISRQSGKQVDGAVEYDFKELKDTCDGREYGNCASTRSLFMRVEDLLRIGGFHPVLLPHYASDYEWTIRACRRYGYKVYCDPTLRYFVDEETTGFNIYDDMTRKKVFSKRSVSNPFYRFSFIFLAVPGKYLLHAFCTQIKRYIGKREAIRDIMKK